MDSMILMLKQIEYLQILPKINGNELLNNIFGKLNDDYFKECISFRDKLNKSTLFPMSYQHADLIKHRRS